MIQNTASADALRAKIDVHRPAIAMAAHNPLAAKLAANAGFDAIWGSGFELSASYAVPDANILSMSTHLEMMRAIGEVQDAPVIADLDTGFGNAVNIAYVVPQYAAAGVAAVVIEDKTFPKDTSLRPGGRQELVPVGEFQGKVAAAKAAGGVLVIARTEALIHSKEKTPDEILAFCQAWPGRVPLVLVPTSYPQLSFADVAALGKVGLIICGNHAIRAAVAAMQNVFRRILAEGGIAGVETDIVSVADVFALQGDARMREIEKTFLR
jgi:2-methylisocitrate lyase-like PEP mutase family enzyme